MLSVEPLGSQEQRLIAVACKANGDSLEEDDPEKLLRFPEAFSPAPNNHSVGQAPPILAADMETRKQQCFREINQRNQLIEQLEVQLRQQVSEKTLFTIAWELQ